MTSEQRTAIEGWINEGDHIAVYQNMALDSGTCGHVIFIRVGEGATLKTAPKQAPDGSWGIGWKYRLIKEVITKEEIDEFIIPLLGE